jgi:DNA-directed RNA polymerase specialized sigma24 family protein
VEGGRVPTDGKAITLESALAGVLALLVDERECRIAGDKDTTKTEVVLARAGVSVYEIAAVMGKKRDAVRMAVSRAKAG